MIPASLLTKAGKLSVTKLKAASVNTLMGVAKSMGYKVSKSELIEFISKKSGGSPEQMAASAEETSIDARFFKEKRDHMINKFYEDIINDINDINDKDVFKEIFNYHDKEERYPNMLTDIRNKNGNNTNFNFINDVVMLYKNNGPDAYDAQTFLLKRTEEEKGTKIEGIELYNGLINALINKLRATQKALLLPPPERRGTDFNFASLSGPELYREKLEEQIRKLEQYKDKHHKRILVTNPGSEVEVNRRENIVLGTAVSGGRKQRGRNTRSKVKEPF